MSPELPEITLEEMAGALRFRARQSYSRSVTIEDGAVKASLLDSEVWVTKDDKINLFVDANGGLTTYRFSDDEFATWARLTGSNVLAVVARHKENVDWLQNFPVPYVVCEKSGRRWGSAPFAPHETPMLNKGYEASSYLSYIIDSYDALPEYAIFCHAHETSFHEPMPKGQNVSSLKFDKEYQSINSPAMYQTLSPKKNSQQYGYLQIAWPNLFAEPIPYKLSFHSCAQFCVSKAAILRHPKSFYQKCLSWLYATDMADQFSARVFEYSWAYMFNGRVVE